MACPANCHRPARGIHAYGDILHPRRRAVTSITSRLSMDGTSCVPGATGGICGSNGGGYCCSAGSRPSLTLRRVRIRRAVALATTTTTTTTTMTMMTMTTTIPVQTLLLVIKCQLVCFATKQCSDISSDVDVDTPPCFKHVESGIISGCSGISGVKRKCGSNPTNRPRAPKKRYHICNPCFHFLTTILFT